MPKRAQRKRQQRRQRHLENDINTNGVDEAAKHGGEFRVYSKKANQYVTGPVNWEQAHEVWLECGDCMILNYRHH